MSKTGEAESWDLLNPTGKLPAGLCRSAPAVCWLVPLCAASSLLIASQLEKLLPLPFVHAWIILGFGGKSVSLLIIVSMSFPKSKAVVS